MAGKQKEAGGTKQRVRCQIVIVGEPAPYRMATVYLMAYGLSKAEAERRIAKIRREDEEAARVATVAPAEP